MDDVIYRQDAINVLNAKCKKAFNITCGEEDCACAEYMALRDLPSADAVEVVRCHKCIHWDEDTVRRNSNDATWWNEAVCRKYSDDIWEAWKDADWFCADGERKTDV